LAEHTTALYADNQLVGIAPLCASGPTLGLTGGEEIADFLDVIALPGHGTAMAEAVADALDCSGCDEGTFRNLRADSTCYLSLPEVASRRGLAVSVEQEDVSPCLRLPASWESYQQDCLSRKDRHELRRKLRRLHSAGHVTWYASTDLSRLDRDMADYIRMHRQSDEEKAEFMSAEMEEWFRALAKAFAPSGTMRLYFLELDGKRVAGTICFVYRNQLLLYNSGYDPDFASLSVGLALKAYNIHDAIESGFDVFDFLQGSESYKYDLGASDAPIYHVRLANQHDGGRP
jgi:CelD/BcsL family acetyltransferase involved in cellulose biosynthesis